MERYNLIESLSEQSNIPAREIQMYLDMAEFRKVKKNEHIVQIGDPRVTLVLIQSGCMMTYFEDKRKGMHVFQFGMEMWWSGDLEAITKGNPSFYGIKAILPSEVYLIDFQLFNTMLTDQPLFQRYFRIIFQNALISHQKRIVRNISYTAEEKYLEFIELYPKVQLIIPQKYIASYLGITPEFLSKIRRKLAGK